MTTILGMKRSKGGFGEGVDRVMCIRCAIRVRNGEQKRGRSAVLIIHKKDGKFRHDVGYCHGCGEEEINRIKSTR